jgi:hypothetical protein
MALTFIETQAVDEIANALYNFLPGSPFPGSDRRRSFPGVAQDLGLADYWMGGNKRPAVCGLLEQTLDNRRGDFCRLIVEIVRRGRIYRNSKGDPVTREEIAHLNQLIERVRFKIPELREPTFLNSLVSTAKTKDPDANVAKTIPLEDLRSKLLEIEKSSPQARGFAFERFLRDLFEAFGLAPHSSFRLIGEQIDGSLQLDGEIYLIEAKWQNKPVDNSELLIFRGKVEGKSTWTRGIFISYGGFSEDGLVAFSRGRSTNIIAMTGQDLYFILEGRMSLTEALKQKVRHAAETGEILISVYELALELPS